ncbi:ABC transporter C family member 3, partial [Symbiodinium microadriaticum]
MTVYRWPARDLRRLEGVSRSPGMSHFSDSVKGANTIRAYGHEAHQTCANIDSLGATIPRE